MSVLRPRWRRRLPLAVLAVVALAALATTAFGYWSGADTHGEGIATAGAATVAGGAAPTAEEESSTNVVVTWGRSILSNGVAVSGYVVKRYAESDGTVATITGGCSGTIAARTCTEAATPPGDWQYTVTPVIGTNWRGAESSKSGGVDTGPGSFELDRELFGGTVAPLPAVGHATLSGFASGETVTYWLDDVTLVGATPTQVGTDGTATVSFTLPAGTSDGPHSISVLGHTADASAGIVVDNTPPTISTFLTPASNAAGWNQSAPVQVDRTASDGTGSGLAYVKYTDDGSDPKTDPNGTARFVTAPVSVSTTTTLKYYQADLAGNLSPVLTRLVKIDAAPPLFAVALVNIQGGVYQGPPPSPGVPGIAYYRGAAAGSLRFKVTPVSIPGRSAPISAGFSALPPDAFGFSFDSSAVTTPAGGPFVSNAMSWAAGTTSNPHGTISLTNEAGNTFGAPGSLVNDSTAPTGGSVDASGLVGTGGRYSTSLTMSLQLAKGADAASGLADATGPSDVPATLMRASATLSSSDGVVNGSCGTYSADAQVGASNPASAVSDTVPTDRRCYRYRYLVPDHVGNIATYSSPDIKVIAVPAGSLTPSTATLTAVTGTASQSISGSTVYYNPAQLGSFNVDSSASAIYTGIAQFSYPSIAGFTGGGVVTTPLTGSTFRSTYAWSANTASPSPGAQPITAMNNAGENATNPSAFSVVKDGTGPSGGTVDATGLVGVGSRYATSMTVSVAFTPGTDTGAGLASTGAQFLRASASLISGVCGTFGAYTLIGLNDPISPKSDTVPVDRTCYSYEYAVHDKVGNQTIYTSPAVKVYAAAPAPPALSFSGFTNASWSGSGAAVYYRPAAISGGFTVTATSADAASYAFPTLPASWGASSGTLGIRNYSWTAANPTAPSGSQIVTMTSNAGTTSTAGFTVTPDSTPPTGGSLSYTNGYTTGSAVTVTLVRGTDAGSGLAAATGTVEVSSATLAGGNCGTFGAYSTAATNPALTVSLPVLADTCVHYRYTTSDGVGNAVTYTSASTVKGDDAPPTDSPTVINAVHAYFDGTGIFFKSNVAGSFTIVNTVTDTGSGPASTTFPAIATAGWFHPVETVSTPTGGPYTSSSYSWSPGASTPTPKTLFSTDLAGKTSSTGAGTFQSDTTAPTGATISYANTVVNATSVPITTSAGTDALSGVDTPIVMRDSAPLTTLTETCGAWVGTYATVTLVGGVDTSVASGRCYRYEVVAIDNVGNQAAAVTSASGVMVDTSGPQVTAIVSQDNDGQLEKNDKLILTFNQSLTGVATGSFSGATEIRPASGNVTLTIPGITQGAVGTGSPGYLSATGTATFSGSTAVTGSGTATTVTITVSSTPTGTGTASSTGALAFTPSTAIKDGGANAATGTFTTIVDFKLF
jgi:hypothetical protein